MGIILAALDWPQETNAPTIGMSHLARAMEICEEWRASAHRALAGATTCDVDKLLQRILRQVGRYMPSGATLRDLYKSMKDQPPADIEEALAQLQRLGEIYTVDVGAGQKGGRPTIKYRLGAG